MESDVAPPSPSEDERSVWHGEKITGWVRLRFDVTETGDTDKVEILESSDERLEAQAEEMLESWPFKAGMREGVPARFENIEMIMAFYTDDTTTTGEALGATVIIVLLLPLVLVMALVSGGGTFAMGR